MNEATFKPDVLGEGRLLASFVQRAARNKNNQPKDLRNEPTCSAEHGV